MSGVALNIGSLSRFGGRIASLSRSLISQALQAAWSPTSWFSASEQGLWYDPTDLTRYMATGPELVTNGAFDADVSGWTTANATIAWSAGTAVITRTASNGTAYQAFTTEVGKRYLVRGSALSGTAGAATRVNKTDSINPFTPNSVVVATNTGVALFVVFTATATTTYIHFCNAGSDGTTIIVSDISVRELTSLNTATMYQDSAGTTPVTAVEQPVGLILDRRLGALGALGSELVTNGGFATDASGWTPSNGTLTVVGGELRITATATGVVAALQTLTTVVNRTYQVRLRRYRVSGAATVGVGVVDIGGTVTTVGFSAATTSEPVSFFFTARQTSTELQLRSGNTTATGEVYAFDDVSIREVPGNHATQATSTARPTLRNRYNLLTYSEQFDNAAWAKAGAPTVTANYATSPIGTGTAVRLQLAATTSAEVGVQQNFASTAGANVSYTLRVWLMSNTGATQNIRLKLTHASVIDNYATVAVTASWQQFSFTVTNGASAGTGQLSGVVNTLDNAAKDILIWGAQLVTAADASLPYQRIAAATDYDSDASKFPLYLACDGSDDSLATGSINFSATDKMTAVIGAHKTSDASTSTFFELTVNAGTTAGGFGLFTNVNGYRVRSGGSVQIDATTTNVPAPATRVSTVTGDIGADNLTLRTNGVVSVVSTADQGTGNYANAVLYIGRRASASLPFNGRIHQLIIRGAASTDIAQAESFVAGKTGVTI